MDRKLLSACKKGNVPTVTDIVKQVKDGSEKLTVAAWWNAFAWAYKEKGDRQVVKLLVDAGTDRNMQDPNGCTVVMRASKEGYADIAELLIDAGADIQLQDKLGRTALMWASKNNHVEVVKLLVAAKANKDTQNRDGYTALMVAVQNGHIDIVKLLVDAGANAHVENKDGTTAVEQASSNSHADIEKQRANAPDKDGCTALTRASKANVRIQDTGGKTALIWASLYGRDDMVRVLLASGAKKNLQDKNGHSALLYASDNGHVEVVKVLLAARAKVHQRSKGESTALMQAAAQGHLDVVKLLLAAGAKPTDRDYRRYTARDWALEGGYSKIAKVLLAASTKLHSLSALNQSALCAPRPAPVSASTAPLSDPSEAMMAQLEAECDHFHVEVANAPQRRDLSSRIAFQQAQIDTALMADDFELVASLGVKLQALQQESAQLPLSEEDYLTLADRHAALVQRVTDKCRELAKAQQFTALGTLSAKLKALRALNVSIAPDDGENSSMIVIKEEGSAPGPAIVDHAVWNRTILKGTERAPVSTPMEASDVKRAREWSAETKAYPIVLDEEWKKCAAGVKDEGAVGECDGTKHRRTS